MAPPFPSPFPPLPLPEIFYFVIRMMKSASTVYIYSAKDAKVTTLQKRLVSIFDDVAPRFASSWIFLDGIIENFRSREKNQNCFFNFASKLRNEIF